MKTISLLTVKGGVGKTTTSIHLGAAFAEQDLKILIIDLDPQMNLSTGFKIDDSIHYTVKNFIEGDFKDFSLFQKGKNIFVLKGDQNLDAAKYNLHSLKQSLSKLETNLNFDIVIIDCPPRPIVKDSLTKLALIASDYLISPIIANEYSINGINSLYPAYLDIKKDENKKLEFLGFFFNMVKENSVFFKKYRRIARENVNDFLFKNHIRQNVLVDYSIEKGSTVFEQKNNSNIADDYRMFAKEIIKKIKL